MNATTITMNATTITMNATVIWGGLSPDLLSKISTYPELCREAERVLESMYCASLPREVHVRDLVDKQIRQYCNSSKQFGQRRPAAARAMVVTPCPSSDRESFLHFSDMSICRSGIHTHCLTCHKPPKGYTGCRLCRPAGMVESTGPVELLDVTPTPDEQTNNKDEIVYEVLPEQDITTLSDKVGSDNDGQISTPDSRLIVWEIKRPVLSGLPKPPGVISEEKKDDGAMLLDDCHIEKEWYISNLENAMMGNMDKELLEDITPDEVDTLPFKLPFPCPAPQTICSRDFIWYDPPSDGSCLFNAVLKCLHKMNLMTSVLPDHFRSVLMDYLLENKNVAANEIFTWGELTMLQKNDVEEQIHAIMNRYNDSTNQSMWKLPITSVDEYIENMKIHTPWKCCWGDSLEIKLMSKMCSANIVVYVDGDTSSSTLTLRETVIQGPECPTIYILYTNGGTHYKTIVGQHKVQIQQPLIEAKFSFVNQLVSELRGMKLNDLKSLYANVSNSVIERNGMVADFNVLLTALMSCNTNSLFLGSREQSKGALFYIGPYICKNGVQIIDSFDLLLEAQDYAKQYPSTAEDSSTDKRFVQHVLTRLLNKMNSLMEVSDTQAAAALLGMDAGMCSDIFISYDANAYLQQILDEKKYGEGGYDSQDDESCNKLDNDEESMSSFIVPDEDDLSYSDNDCDNDNDEN